MKTNYKKQVKRFMESLRVLDLMREMDEDSIKRKRRNKIHHVSGRYATGYATRDIGPPETRAN